MTRMLYSNKNKKCIMNSQLLSGHLMKPDFNIFFCFNCSQLLSGYLMKSDFHILFASIATVNLGRDDNIFSNQIIYRLNYCTFRVIYGTVILFHIF